MATKISVITVVKNYEDGLARTGESLRAQRPDFLQNAEWLVINGSDPDDATHDVLARFKDNISFSISKPDKNLYDAMNKGLDHATGRFIWYMNAGDTFYGVHAASNVLKVIDENPDAEMIYGDCLYDGFVKKGRSMRQAAWRMVAAHQSTLFQRDAVNAMKLRHDDTHYKIAADGKFFLEFCQTKRKGIYVPEILSNFEGGGVSDTQCLRAAKEMYRIRQELGVGNTMTNFLKSAAAFTGKSLRNISPDIYRTLRQFQDAVAPHGAVQANEKMPENIHQTSPL